MAVSIDLIKNHQVSFAKTHRKNTGEIQWRKPYLASDKWVWLLYILTGIIFQAEAQNFVE